jgi:ABC-type Mn2+/Zn2+ transport system permease subunit
LGELLAVPFTSVKFLAVGPGLLAVFLGSQWRELCCIVLDEGAKAKLPAVIST